MRCAVCLSSVTSEKERLRAITNNESERKSEPINLRSIIAPLAFLRLFLPRSNKKKENDSALLMFDGDAIAP